MLAYVVLCVPSERANAVHAQRGFVSCLESLVYGLNSQGSWVLIHALFPNRGASQGENAAPGCPLISTWLGDWLGSFLVIIGLLLPSLRREEFLHPSFLLRDGARHKDVHELLEVVLLREDLLAIELQTRHC